MSYTLLQLVQIVGSSIDSDDISSITDSTESSQIATILKTVFFDIISRANLPEHYDLVNLTEVSSSYPVKMTIPSEVSEILWVKYDNATTSDTDVQMRQVHFQDLETFMSRMHQLDESDSTVGNFTLSTSSGAFTVMYLNNKAPEYYTTFDDATLIFDSYDSSVETYLKSTKSLAYIHLGPTWTESDAFVPDLDDPQFSLLINEAKSLAWAELRQTQHAKAEQGAKRNWTTLQHSKYKTEHETYFDRLPNYGRK